MILFVKCNYIKGVVNLIFYVVDMCVFLYFDWNLNFEILDVFKKNWILLYRCVYILYCILSIFNGVVLGS